MENRLFMFFTIGTIYHKKCDSFFQKSNLRKYKIDLKSSDIWIAHLPFQHNWWKRKIDANVFGVRAFFSSYVQEKKTDNNFHSTGRIEAFIISLFWKLFHFVMSFWFWFIFVYYFFSSLPSSTWRKACFAYLFSIVKIISRWKKWTNLNNKKLQHAVSNFLCAKTSPVCSGCGWIASQSTYTHTMQNWDWVIYVLNMPINVVGDVRGIFILAVVRYKVYY